MRQGRQSNYVYFETHILEATYVLCDYIWCCVNYLQSILTFIFQLTLITFVKSMNFI